MINQKWILRYYEMAVMVASWSKDPSRKVGAVIFDPLTHRLISAGFNGYPSGVEDSLDTKSVKLMKTIHAEENAILCASSDLTGAGIVVTHHPCGNCMAKIIQVGIGNVYCPDPKELRKASDSWALHYEIAQRLANQAGVGLHFI